MTCSPNSVRSNTVDCENIHDRAALGANSHEKFEVFNCVKLTNTEFQRLLDGIITRDVYSAAQTLRNVSSFERDDGTPFN